MKVELGKHYRISKPMHWMVYLPCSETKITARFVKIGRTQDEILYEKHFDKKVFNQSYHYDLLMTFQSRVKSGDFDHIPLGV